MIHLQISIARYYRVHYPALASHRDNSISAGKQGSASQAPNKNRNNSCAMSASPLPAVRKRRRLLFNSVIRFYFLVTPAFSRFRSYCSRDSVYAGYFSSRSVKSVCTCKADLGKASSGRKLGLFYSFLYWNLSVIQFNCQKLSFCQFLSKIPDFLQLVFQLTSCFRSESTIFVIILLCFELSQRNVHSITTLIHKNIMQLQNNVHGK